MKKLWKDAIKQAYRAPEAVGKKAFLRRIEGPEMSVKDFLFSQLGYIRKWNWGLAVLFFAIAVFGGMAKMSEMAGILAALTPFLALAQAAESSRSVRYRMDELEMSGRFTLKAVVMARMAVLGTGNLILLGLICPVLLWQGQGVFLYFGISILTPYLLTSFCSLVIVRRIRDKESIYYCSGVTVFVCGFQALLTAVHVDIYDLLRPVSWCGVLTVLVVLTARECRKIWKQTEDYAWN